MTAGNPVGAGGCGLKGNLLLVDLFVLLNAAAVSHTELKLL